MNTVFIGKELIRLESVDSTNKYAANMLRHGMLSDGSIIVASEQFSGKGQRGNDWESEAGKNLTMSLVLKSWELELNAQFNLSMVVGLGILDCLKRYDDRFQLKWPNDILFEKKKIGGVLIENVVKGNRVESSIVGIGINLNQTDFKTESAVSLTNILKTEINGVEFLDGLLEHLESRLLRHKKAPFEEIKEMYLDSLYGFEEKIEISVNQDKTTHQAEVIDLKKNGNLVMTLNEETLVFDLKEITFQL